MHLFVTFLYFDLPINQLLYAQCNFNFVCVCGLTHECAEATG
jgi:hypothetical protein